MADTTKTTSQNDKMNDVRSRVSDVAQNVKTRFSDVSHTVADRVRNPENRWMTYAGLGALGIGLGFGIWALARYMMNRNEDDFIDPYADEARRSDII